MKKLKKFAALLLVGVMALALLTACGGGGGSSTNKAEEQKVMEQIGKVRRRAFRWPVTQSSAQWLKRDWMSRSSIKFSAMQERTGSIRIE